MTTTDPHFPDDSSDPVIEPEKHGAGPIFLIAFVMFIIAVGYFFFYTDEEKKEIELAPPLSQSSIDPTIKAQIEAAKHPKASQQAPAAPEAPLSAQPAASTVQNENSAGVAPKEHAEGDLARELIASIRSGEKTLTLDEIYNQATQMQQRNLETDAYLLYFYAARKEHGPSAFRLASMNDPQYFKEQNQILMEPDPIQAYKWYKVAVSQHVQNASQRLSELKQHIETLAKNGDLGAQTLLLNWK